jgi:hypothetical protein
MSTTSNKGIDYGRGTTNVNPKTGIRYGVIAANSVWSEAMSDIYSHGTDLDHKAYMDGVKDSLRQALSEYFSGHTYNDKPSRLDEATEEAFDAVSDRLNDNYEGTGDCTRYLYERDGYRIQIDGSGDVWVLESPFYTYAQFCSPCAPGACYLTSPLETPDDNNKCYCLGPEWFCVDEAPMPYEPVKINL